MSGYIGDDGMIHAESEEEADKVFYDECFKCWLCNAQLEERLIRITQNGTITSERCINGHEREEN